VKFCGEGRKNCR